MNSDLMAAHPFQAKRDEFDAGDRCRTGGDMAICGFSRPLRALPKPANEGCERLDRIDSRLFRLSGGEPDQTTAFETKPSQPAIAISATLSSSALSAPSRARIAIPL